MDGEDGFMHYGQRLSWHEKLDIHELVAFQANGLIMLKKNYKKLTENTLKELYRYAIRSLEKSLTELLHFYPAPPHVSMKEGKTDSTSFYAGNLLGLAKTSVRNYAIAMTETNSPALREVLAKQLNKAVQLHGKVYDYMYQKGYYLSYDLNQLLATDYRNATTAIQMEY
jgi:spore coat protein F